MTQDTEHALIKISEARRAIAEAKHIDEVKDIRDKAEAVRVYAKQAGLSLEIVNDAAEIKIRAEYKAGQLLKEMQERGERKDRGGDRKSKSHDVTLIPSLSDIGVSKNESSRWQTLASIPEDEFDSKLSNQRAAVRELTTNGMLKLAARIDRAEERAIRAAEERNKIYSERWEIYHGDLSTWESPRQYDYIITDPPYKKEFLPLYSVLGARAKEWLKPGGLLIALSGQYYLPELMAMLGEHLEYFWTAAYLVRGESAGVFQRKILPQWKPLLIYKQSGPLLSRQFSDVFESPSNDKRHHVWGQSVGGMYDVVSKVCEPGSFILDPFCGAGTTGVAALMAACSFHGLEIDEQNCSISRERLMEAASEQMA